MSKSFFKSQRIIFIAIIVFLSLFGAIRGNYPAEGNSVSNLGDENLKNPILLNGILEARAQVICTIDADCADGDFCTADICSGGTCSNVQACGGIVPCGRLVDNPVTPYNEKEPCTLCHIFIMLQIISTFAIEMGGIVAVFFLVVGGLIYATSAGSQNRMELGKKAVTWAIFGLAIILLSWLIVTIVLTALGYIDPLGGKWNIVSCTVA